MNPETVNILYLVVGFVVGAGTVTFHHMQVRKAVEAAERKSDAHIKSLNAELKRLKENADCIERSRDCKDAYHRGVEKGRTSPATQAEMFAKTFENRRVQFHNTDKTA